MVQMSLGNSGRFLNEEWHSKRWEAETETFSIEEWGDIDRERYDLDSVDFSRKFKRSSHITDARIESEGSAKAGFDLRHLDDARD